MPRVRILPASSNKALQPSGNGWLKHDNTLKGAWTFRTKEKIQCLCEGGKRCSKESPDAQGDVSAIPGLHSNWVGENACMLAMARPWHENMLKYKLVDAFIKHNIGMVLNLQEVGEHEHCGPGNLPTSGFSYDPEQFMAAKIHFFNFSWRDMGVPALDRMMDIVQVMDYVMGVEKRKVAVHCHAGLGRTGLAIACYILYQHRTTGTCCSKTVIESVRQGRPGALQTRTQELFVSIFQQYLLHHSCLFCGVEGPPKGLEPLNSSPDLSTLMPNPQQKQQQYQEPAPPPPTLKTPFMSGSMAALLSRKGLGPKPGSAGTQQHLQQEGLTSFCSEPRDLRGGSVGSSPSLFPSDLINASSSASSPSEFGSAKGPSPPLPPGASDTSRDTCVVGAAPSPTKVYDNGLKVVGPSPPPEASSRGRTPQGRKAKLLQSKPATQPQQKQQVQRTQLPPPWDEKWCIHLSKYSTLWVPQPPRSYAEALQRQQRLLHGSHRRSCRHLHRFVKKAAFVIITAAQEARAKQVGHHNGTHASDTQQVQDWASSMPQPHAMHHQMQPQQQAYLQQLLQQKQQQQQREQLELLQQEQALQHQKAQQLQQQQQLSQERERELQRPQQQQAAEQQRVLQRQVQQLRLEEHMQDQRWQAQRERDSTLLPQGPRTLPTEQQLQPPSPPAVSHILDRPKFLNPPPQPLGPVPPSALKMPSMCSARRSSFNLTPVDWNPELHDPLSSPKPQDEPSPPPHKQAPQRLKPPGGHSDPELQPQAATVQQLGLQQLSSTPLPLSQGKSSSSALEPPSGLPAPPALVNCACTSSQQVPVVTAPACDPLPFTSQPLVPVALNHPSSSSPPSSPPVPNQHASPLPLSPPTSTSKPASSLPSAAPDQRTSLLPPSPSSASDCKPSFGTTKPVSPAPPTALVKRTTLPEAVAPVKNTALVPPLVTPDLPNGSHSTLPNQPEPAEPAGNSLPYSSHPLNPHSSSVPPAPPTTRDQRTSPWSPSPPLALNGRPSSGITRPLSPAPPSAILKRSTLPEATQSASNPQPATCSQPPAAASDQRTSPFSPSPPSISDQRSSPFSPSPPAPSSRSTVGITRQMSPAPPSALVKLSPGINLPPAPPSMQPPGQQDRGHYAGQVDTQPIELRPPGLPGQEPVTVFPPSHQQQPSQHQPYPPQGCVPGPIAEGVQGPWQAQPQEHPWYSTAHSVLTTHATLSPNSSNCHQALLTRGSMHTRDTPSTLGHDHHPLPHNPPQRLVIPPQLATDIPHPRHLANPWTGVADELYPSQATDTEPERSALTGVRCAQPDLAARSASESTQGTTLHGVQGSVFQDSSRWPGPVSEGVQGPALPSVQEQPTRISSSQQHGLGAGTGLRPLSNLGKGCQNAPTHPQPSPPGLSNGYPNAARLTQQSAQGGQGSLKATHSGEQPGLAQQPSSSKAPPHQKSTQPCHSFTHALAMCVSRHKLQQQGIDVVASLADSPTYSARFLGEKTGWATAAGSQGGAGGLEEVRAHLQHELLQVKRRANHEDFGPAYSAPLLVVVQAMQDFFDQFAVPALSQETLKHASQHYESLPYELDGSPEPEQLQAAAQVIQPIPVCDQELLMLFAALMRHCELAGEDEECTKEAGPEEHTVVIGRWALQLMMGPNLNKDVEEPLLSLLWYFVCNDAAYAALVMAKKKRIDRLLHSGVSTVAHPCQHPALAKYQHARQRPPHPQTRQHLQPATPQGLHQPHDIRLPHTMVDTTPIFQQQATPDRITPPHPPIFTEGPVQASNLAAALPFQQPLPHPPSVHDVWM